MMWVWSLLACAQPPAPEPACGFELATRVGYLRDGRLEEVSGLEASGGALWVHNDSGDDARFFALDPATGKTLATFPLKDVSAIDWEDMAIDRSVGEPGTLLLADIGDNLASREAILIHRVAIPSRLESRALPATTFTIRYPDGAHNAESLMVDPRSGEVWVVTKERGGTAGFYATRLPSEPTPLTLEHRGSFTFPSEHRGTDLTTGATFSPDGSAFVVRTYTDAWVWPAADGVAAALGQTPCRLRLHPEEQGEAIAWTKDGLLTVSEGLRSPIWRYPPSP